MDGLLNVADFERAARDRLEPATFDYIAGGAWDEVTLAENVAAFGRWRLRPHALVDVGLRDLSVVVLQDRSSMPIGIAPSAFHKLIHADGEVATAQAAGAAGTVMCLSIMATTSIEEVASVATGPLWLQTYIFRDRDLTMSLAERAKSAGYRALLVTVDTPVLGRRERDPRNRFELPPGIEMRNLSLRAAAGEYQSPMVRFVSEQIDPTLTWGEVEWFVRTAALPVLVKGVLRGDDARRAQQAGVHGVIVSNHGGRQLDGAIATLDALPEVASALEGSGLPVLMDGGIRRGTDVIKALALGATMVLVGRPVLWGLAVGGRSGAEAVLELLRRELDTAMALAGCARVADVDRDLLVGHTSAG